MMLLIAINNILTKIAVVGKFYLVILLLQEEPKCVFNLIFTGLLFLFKVVLYSYCWNVTVIFLNPIF